MLKEFVIGCLNPSSVKVGLKALFENSKGLVGKILIRGELTRLLSLRNSFPEILKIAPPLIT